MSVGSEFGFGSRHGEALAAARGSLRHKDAHADITGTSPALPSSRVVSSGGIPPAPFSDHTMFRAADGRALEIAGPGSAGVITQAGPRRPLTK